MKTPNAPLKDKLIIISRWETLQSGLGKIRIGYFFSFELFGLYALGIKIQIYHNPPKNTHTLWVVFSDENFWCFFYGGFFFMANQAEGEQVSTMYSNILELSTPWCP